MLACKECHRAFTDDFEARVHKEGHRQRRAAEAEMMREVCRADIVVLGEAAVDEWTRLALEQFKEAGGFLRGEDVLLPKGSNVAEWRLGMADEKTIHDLKDVLNIAPNPRTEWEERASARKTAVLEAAKPGVTNGKVADALTGYLREEAFLAIGPSQKRMVSDYLKSVGMGIETDSQYIAWRTDLSRQEAERKFGPRRLDEDLKTCPVCGFQDCLCPEFGVSALWARAQQEADEGLRFVNRLERFAEEARLEFRAPDPDRPVREKMSGPVRITFRKPEKPGREDPEQEPLLFEPPKKQKSMGM